MIGWDACEPDRRSIPRPRLGRGFSDNFGRYDLRASWNYTDPFPEGSGTNISTIKLRGQRWTLDASVKYRLTR